MDGTETTPALGEAHELVARAAGRRAAGWQVLALAFYEPTARWVEALRSGQVYRELAGATDWLDTDGERFLPHMAALDAAARRAAAAEPADTLEEVRAEHTRLFLGPRKALVSPYESVWCDRDPDSGAPIVRGPSTVEVERMYAEHGLGRADAHHDLPDHVATEMEFLHFLCREEAAAWSQGDGERAKELRQAESAFLERHLARFAPALCERVAAETTLDLYRALAGILTVFLSVEAGADYAGTVVRDVFADGRRS